MLQPEGHCTKTGDRVLEVLQAKHPDARPPSAACLDAYPGPPPEMVLVDITDDVVSAVAGRLFGERGQGVLIQSVSNTGSFDLEQRAGL